ncbi:MAG: class II fructose-bisphosphate aldolase, partial [Candidatus Moraniibacteriota bacterium]
ETTRAIVAAAKEMRSPVIIQVTEKTMEYAGGRGIFHLIKNDAEFYAAEIPIGIHLDHGKSLEIIQRAVAIGFTSVMYDGSRKVFTDNLEITKKVVEFCHKSGVDVQGELGSVPYLGEAQMGDIDWDKYMTDPAQARTFVEETGIDALAVAIGNAHGFLKERAQPDFDRMAMINKNCPLPFVLHGASDWENGRVVEAIKNGVSCFNVDTAIRIAFVNNLINSVSSQGELGFDLRKLLGGAQNAVKETVKYKMKIFGSDGKA